MIARVVFMATYDAWLSATKVCLYPDGITVRYAASVSGEMKWFGAGNLRAAVQ